MLLVVAGLPRAILRPAAVLNVVGHALLAVARGLLRIEVALVCFSFCGKDRVTLRPVPALKVVSGFLGNALRLGLSRATTEPTALATAVQVEALASCAVDGAGRLAGDLAAMVTGVTNMRDRLAHAASGSRTPSMDKISV